MKQHAKECPKLICIKDDAKYCSRNEHECTCDGYHTFDELYEHRIWLWLKLCEALAKDSHNVWRSKFHSDGSNYEGWFVLGLYENERQMTYHLPEKVWGYTEFARTLKKAPDFDGHTSDDVLERLKIL